MRTLDHFRMGLRSILAHKLRSGLTALGVVFGVAAVVSMLSIAGGARRAALEQIRQLGTHSLRVAHVELTGPAGEKAERRGSRGLHTADAAMLGASIPGLVAQAPLRFVEEAVMRRGRESSARIVATDSGLARVTDRRASLGRFIADLDVSEAKRVAVLGAGVRSDLFGSQDPLGQEIRIGGIRFTVVGWMSARTEDSDQPGAIQLQDVDRDVYVPISTAQQRFPDPRGPGALTELAIRVEGPELLAAAEDISRRLLARSHRGVADYALRLPDELLAQSRRTQRVFNVVLGSIAAISLLVGGIGIMNVMLTTVTERTREIGVRRAVGASRRVILRQFLIETVTISAGGGLLGIGVGLALGEAIQRYAGWQASVSPLDLVLAFGVSALVGVVFGLVPARRAANLDPIEALRFE
jgi:putative ABC transport system permease protein